MVASSLTLVMPCVWPRRGLYEAEFGDLSRVGTGSRQNRDKIGPQPRDLTAAPLPIRGLVGRAQPTATEPDGVGFDRCLGALVDHPGVGASRGVSSRPHDGRAVAAGPGQPPAKSLSGVAVDEVLMVGGGKPVPRLRVALGVAPGDAQILGQPRPPPPPPAPRRHLQAPR